MDNNKRLSNGVQSDAKFLSCISHNERMWLYNLRDITITGVVYWCALRTIDGLFFTGLSAKIVLYQIVNFHHDAIDRKIWYLSKLKLQTTQSIDVSA
ncbi:hypothetical protein [Ruegeria sp. Alg231-54]|uniref:hypothetical protein n=1 Tax=Ruegeria sp. Alg231-54 TaxID=1922221 RepID=UPI000D54C548|nr:hypothetical protein [Ruegeria sp. Alg231-54]